MTLMRVKALTYDHNADQAAVVLEELTGGVGLGFLVPMNEADRLARTLGLTPCPCVPVLDLVEDILAHFEASISRIILDGADAGISAVLYLGQDGAEAAFPCHPADALALAKRAGTPIYATDAALRHACPLDRPHGHEAADVGEWLERVRPEDFAA